MWRRNDQQQNEQKPQRRLTHRLSLSSPFIHKGSSSAKFFQAFFPRNNLPFHLGTRSASKRISPLDGKGWRRGYAGQVMIPGGNKSPSLGLVDLGKAAFLGQAIAHQSAHLLMSFGKRQAATHQFISEISSRQKTHMGCRLHLFRENAQCG